MKAKVGDKIVVKGHLLGEPDRDAVVLEVHGGDGQPPYMVQWSADEALARRELHLVVDGADEHGLVAPIQRRLVCDNPASALLKAVKDADLLVVGSQGLGAVGDATLGSVSHGVIRDAPCPVVVVPPEGK